MSAEQGGPVAILIGPMAAGKTSVGRCLARRLGTTFLDLDEEIVARADAPVPQIFAERGEDGFRALEAEVLAELLEVHPGVLALGGGAPLTPVSRARLRGRPVVLLEIDERTARRRLRGGAGRPLLAGADPLAAWRRLWDQRAEAYRDLAVLRVDGGAGRTAAVASDIERLLVRDEADADDPTTKEGA